MTHLVHTEAVRKTRRGAKWAARKRRTKVVKVAGIKPRSELVAGPIFERCKRLFMNRDLPGELSGLCGHGGLATAVLPLDAESTPGKRPYSSHSSSILPCRGYGPAPSSRRPPMGIAARLRSSGRDMLCRRPATAS